MNRTRLKVVKTRCKDVFSTTEVRGRYVPPSHVPCIANFLGQGGSAKYRLTWKWLRFFKNDRDISDLITCGAAAGVGAAFRTRVGGVRFALEEAASNRATE